MPCSTAGVSVCVWVWVVDNRTKKLLHELRQIAYCIYTAATLVICRDAYISLLQSHTHTHPFLPSNDCFAFSLQGSDLASCHCQQNCGCVMLGFYMWGKMRSHLHSHHSCTLQFIFSAANLETFSLTSGTQVPRFRTSSLSR